MLAETICSAVSAAGLGIAAVTAYRKRFLTAARVVAYSLVPVGLVMTGVVGWLARTAFDPLAWAGFGVLALSVVLFLLTRAVERRRDRGKGAIRGGDADPVAPAASAPSLGRGSARASRPAAPPATTGSGSGSGDDFSDIEAILKKHGI
ncbi:hypothetical protein ACWDO7_15255 [Streptomyces sp. NPDC003656]|uniref:hypothetical protein n=1 Tax=Streptomyces sp. DSM 110735 TaxID=2775031 RepID=UPI0018F32D7F|nr:hypothetical protein [Streptomyces sp. DSM 110735]MBJ7906876.1 hypothetical protein [Streptomyces sp. DSM 110735]